MSQPISDEKLTAITDAIFRGRKIEAIKLYRECAAVGLAEAKAAVEKLETELRAASPEKFSPAATGAKGCASLLLMAIVVAAILVWRVGGRP